MRRTLLCIACLAIMASGEWVRAATQFATVANNANGASTLKTTTLSGPLSTGFSLGNGFFGGVAFDSSEGAIYVIAQDSNGLSTFYATTPDGPVYTMFPLGNGFTGGLAYRQANDMYYAIASDANGFSILYSITPAGTITSVLALGNGFLGGLAYHSTNGYLYAIANDSNGASMFYRIALSPPSITAVGSMGTGFYGGLTYDPTANQLYAIGNSSSGVSTIYSVSTTGTTASVYTLDSAYNFYGLAPILPVASNVLFINHPSEGYAFQVLPGQPSVGAYDDDGNLAISFNGPVTLYILNNPCGGTLLGPTSVQAVNGVATFNDLYIDKPCTGYTLAAQSDFGEDVSHSFNISTAIGRGFYPLTPCRIFDTREPTGPTGGQPLQSGARDVFTVAGVCGIPSNAKSIVTNVTVVNATGTGEFRVVAGNIFSTITSAISVPLTRARANNATVQLATDLSGTIASINSTTGTVHLIIDVNGYFR